MTIHDIRFPGESVEYRHKRDELLQAEIALRAQIEKVAALRRGLPAGGMAENYVFAGERGPISLHELFGDHSTLIVYSFMFGGQQTSPCPMCTAFVDSVSGQIKHINQRAAFAVVVRSPLEPMVSLAAARGWVDVPFLSARDNRYPVDYHSELANGAQVPMCNVFIRKESGVHHFWNSEMFFAPSETQPRHIDMLWPLWNFFDITPEGRGDFMPRLNY